MSEKLTINMKHWHNLVGRELPSESVLHFQTYETITNISVINGLQKMLSHALINVPATLYKPTFWTCDWNLNCNSSQMLAHKVLKGRKKFRLKGVIKLPRLLLRWKSNQLRMTGRDHGLNLLHKKERWIFFDSGQHMNLIGQVNMLWSRYKNFVSHCITNYIPARWKTTHVTQEKQIMTS